MTVTFFTVVGTAPFLQLRLLSLGSLLLMVIFCPRNGYGACRKPKATDSSTPTRSERYHYSIDMFSYLQTSERLNNSQRNFFPQCRLAGLLVGKGNNEKQNMEIMREK